MLLVTTTTMQRRRRQGLAHDDISSTKRWILLVFLFLFHHVIAAEDDLKELNISVNPKTPTVLASQPLVPHDEPLNIIPETERQSPYNPNYKYLITTLQQPQPYQQVVQLPYVPVAAPPATAAPPAATTTTTTPAPPTTTTLAPTVFIGSPCVTDAGCTSVKGSRCVANICTCGTGTVALSNLACIPIATSFNTACIITAQCRGLDPLASCYLDRCLCEGIYHVAGTPCTVQTDYFIPGTATSGLACLRKLTLGQACCDTRQCAYEVWNSVCSATTGLCVCAPGFVNIGTHQCAPIATMIGGACSVNAQCATISGTYCSVNGTCTCDLNQQYVSAISLPTLGGATDRRKRQTMLMPTCMLPMRLGSMCMSNEQCAARTVNAICVMNNCTCRTGFVADPTLTNCLAKNVFFAKPVYEFRGSCCGNQSALTSRFYGQVCPDTYYSTLGPPYTYTASDPRFTIDTNGGVTSLSLITVSTTFTATVTAYDGRISTARVIIVPDLCCTAVPTFTVPGVTVSLRRYAAATACLPTYIGGTAGVAVAPNPAPTTNTLDALLDIFDYLAMPCGEQPSATVLITSTGTPATTNPICTFSGGLLSFFGMGTAIPSIAAGMSASCIVTATATACNGQVSTTSLTVTLACPM